MVVDWDTKDCFNFKCKENPFQPISPPTSCVLVNKGWGLVQAIEKEEGRSAVGHIVSGIVQEKRSFADVKVKHIGRMGNKIAHELAQQAKIVKDAMCWLGREPDIIADLLKREGV